jgi:hypothetical protein
MLAQHRFRLISASAISVFVAACSATGTIPNPGGSEPNPNPPAPPLAAPSNVKAYPHEGGIHVTWSDNAGDAETAVEIERREAGDFVKLGSLVFGSVQYHDGSVRPGGTYTYRVRSLSASAASSYSNEATATADPASPPTPDGGVEAPPDAGERADSGGVSRDGGTPTDAEARVVSFQNDVVPIFVGSCGSGSNACHSRIAYAGNPSADCRGWLALEDIPLGSMDPNTGEPTGCPDRTLYERLTQLETWLCDPQRPYVQANSIRRSHIYQVIAGDPTEGGTCTKAPNVPMEEMPPVTQSVFTISPAGIQTIVDWISEGAPNN